MFMHYLELIYFSVENPMVDSENHAGAEQQASAFALLSAQLAHPPDLPLVPLTFP